MSDFKTLSDNELITLLKEGKETAYTQIYDRYYYLMFVFAYKKLRDKEIAKDFVQELFIKLWEKRESIREDGNLAQYLYISLRSRIIDFFIHEKVHHKYLDFLKDYVNENRSEYTDHLIREKQLAIYIENQIQLLPKKMKIIFELSRKGNLTNREIANELSTTESNVSHQISNALKILRKKLNIVIYLTLFTKVMQDDINKDFPVIKLHNHNLVRILNNSQDAINLHFDSIVVPPKLDRLDCN